VLYADQTSRTVYLSAGKWVSLNGEQEYEGGQTVECAAPIDVIPVFRRK
jgi:alpha-D-xyloside xylohydrolase